jgi:peptidase C39-like protein
MNGITVTQTAQLWLLNAALRIGRVLLGPAAKVVMELLPRRRVPLLLQMSVVECGAACLAMILSYYGRRTSASECREWFDIGRDGLTARAIAEAARHYGLRVKAFSLEPRDFKHVSLPAIAHWEFKHFVVVEHWSAKKVEIVDPALGRRQLTAAEFDAGFTGVVLTLEPESTSRGAVPLPGYPGLATSGICFCIPEGRQACLFRFLASHCCYRCWG